MTREQETFNRFVERHPHPHLPYFRRPDFTRRGFFQLLGSGVTGSFLAGRAEAAETGVSGAATPRNTARNVIFILLTGAPSHTDTFDLKMVNGMTPNNFNPATVNGIYWPVGLLPKTADQLSSVCIVRSMQAWALVHSLSQHWTQIGRNPAAALGDIAPNIGSVVAIEKDKERAASQVFPTFVSLNANAGVGPGYLPATYAPFQVTPAATGLVDTTNPNGQSRFETMYSRLHALDDDLRVKSPVGKPLEDYDAFYKSAKGLMYNSAVTSAFSYSSAESARYGGTSFGNACLVSKQVIAANQGTRFIQINLGNWDMHSDIYGAQNARGNNLYTLGKQFDDGFGTLLADLKAAGLLSSTLVVAVGEFGRTVGALSAAGGRDHFFQQSALFAGGGVKGGRTIGSTTADGSATANPGWSRNRAVRPEDVEATIYSALGIDWTTVRYDDPFGRGFEYVPFSNLDLYGPVNELWG